MFKSQLLFGIFIFFIVHNEVVQTAVCKEEEDLASEERNSNNDLKIGRRLIGGRKATEGQFPFMGYLEYDNTMWCAVSIIHSRWLLTAAHCLDLSNIKNATITLGTTQYHGKNGIVLYPEEFYPHKKYRVIPEELNEGLEYVVNDIGLIRLHKDIHFNEKIKQIRIPKLGHKKNHDGELATIAGWGSFYLDSPTPSHLLTTTFKIISADECRKSWNYIKNDHLCTEVKSGKSVCYGDSGGPLISKHGVQIGIISSADADCGFKKPNLFTKVASFVPWIRKTLFIHKDII